MLSMVNHFLIVRRLPLRFNLRCLRLRVVGSALAQEASTIPLLHLLPWTWLVVESGDLIVKNINLLTLLGHLWLLALLGFCTAGRGPGFLLVTVDDGGSLVELSLKCGIVSVHEALFSVS